MPGFLQQIIRSGTRPVPTGPRAQWQSPMIPLDVNEVVPPQAAPTPPPVEQHPPMRPRPPISSPDAAEGTPAVHRKTAAQEPPAPTPPPSLDSGPDQQARSRPVVPPAPPLERPQGPDSGAIFFAAPPRTSVASSNRTLGPARAPFPPLPPAPSAAPVEVTETTFRAPRRRPAISDTDPPAGGASRTVMPIADHTPAPAVQLDPVLSSIEAARPHEAIPASPDVSPRDARFEPDEKLARAERIEERQRPLATPATPSFASNGGPFTAVLERGAADPNSPVGHEPGPRQGPTPLRALRETSPHLTVNHLNVQVINEERHSRKEPPRPPAPTIPREDWGRFERRHLRVP